MTLLPLLMPGEYPISLAQDMRYFHSCGTLSLRMVLQYHTGTSIVIRQLFIIIYQSKFSFMHIINLAIVLTIMENLH